MVSKDRLIGTMEKLSIELNRHHTHSETARFVSQELEVLKKAVDLLSLTNFNISLTMRPS